MHPRYTRAAALFCVFLVTLIACHCSQTVDILNPQDGDTGVSAYGSCVACHTNAQMIEFTASPLSAPTEEAGDS